MLRHLIVATLCLGAVLAAGADAAILDVDCSATTFPTIQAAVNASAPGDVIVVDPACSAFPQAINIIGLDHRQIVSANVPSGYVGGYPVGPAQWPPGNAVIYDFGQSCIFIENSRDISIVGLQFEFCVDDGVTVIDSDHITLQGLAIWAVGADGIAVHSSRDVNIDGNFIVGANKPGRYGISVNGPNDLVRIQNNRLAKNDTGILMEGRRVHVLNNEVSGNVAVGIVVLADLSTVSRNTVLNNGSGVQIDFTALPPDTCLTGNETATGIVPWSAGCQGSNS